MRARSRRIRRQHRKWGKPCGPTSGILVRYRVLWEVFHDPPWRAPGVRRRWLCFNADDGYQRVWSPQVRDWALVRRAKVAP